MNYGFDTGIGIGKQAMKSSGTIWTELRALGRMGMTLTLYMLAIVSTGIGLTLLGRENGVGWLAVVLPWPALLLNGWKGKRRHSAAG